MIERVWKQYNGSVFIRWASASVKDSSWEWALEFSGALSRSKLRLFHLITGRLIVRPSVRSKLIPTFLCSCLFWSSRVWQSVMEEVRTSVLLICGARAFFFLFFPPSSPLNLWFLRTQHEWQAPAQNLTRCSEPVKSLGVHHLCAWRAKCHVIIITISQRASVSVRICTCVCVCAW